MTTSFWLQLDTSDRFIFYLVSDIGGLGTTATGSSLTTTVTLTDTTDWHHVAATFDGSTKKIFLDGVEIGSQAFSITGADIINETSLALSIGTLGATGGGGHDGSLDDVGMYTDALTPAEVNAIYTLGLHPELIYDLGQAQDLFDLHTLASGSLSFGGDNWQYDNAMSGLGLTLGEVTKIDGRFFLLLDSTSGVSTPPVPEPSGLLLLGASAIGLVTLRRRRQRKEQPSVL